MTFAIPDQQGLKHLDDDVLARHASDVLDAFAELYARHHYPVYRFVRSKTGDDEVAQDVTAHVFLKALDRADTFRGDGPYQAWLFRIAQNTITTWRHKEGRAPVAIEVLPEASDPAPSPAAHVVRGEARAFVWDHISELPPDQQRALDLRYLRDLPIEEVGRRMRRSRGAVRVLLHRARERLRRSMEGSDPR
ncbi:MAG: RNA polymerase sigma factor [Actinomycetota bacterium]